MSNLVDLQDYSENMSDAEAMDYLQNKLNKLTFDYQNLTDVLAKEKADLLRDITAVQKTLQLLKFKKMKTKLPELTNLITSIRNVPEYALPKLSEYLRNRINACIANCQNIEKINALAENAEEASKLISRLFEEIELLQSALDLLEDKLSEYNKLLKFTTDHKTILSQAVSALKSGGLTDNTLSQGSQQ